MANREKFTCEQVISALEGAAGILSRAAENLSEATGKGCVPNTVRGYIERHPSVAEAYERIKSTNIDIAENALLQAIRDGNVQAIIFFLRCKGAERGYVLRNRLEDPNGEPFKVSDKAERATVDPSKLSVEELQRLKELLSKSQREA